MRAAWMLLPLTLCAACLRQTEFRCATSDQCGPGGTCEAVGYCSFPGAECQRFGESAGPYANQCVGAQGGDAGIDAPPGDAPAVGCPGNYAPLPNAPDNLHRYRRAPENLTWDAQRTFCAQTAPNAYLAIPNDVGELAGLATVAVTTPFWVGVHDQMTEGTFITVRGDPATFLPWAAGQPDNNAGGMGEDCVAATPTTISDERCTGGGNDLRPAICECEP